MKRFEYKVEKTRCDFSTRRADTIKALNLIGKDGWELVAVVVGSSLVATLYFKRELPDD